MLEAAATKSTIENIQHLKQSKLDETSFTFFDLS